MRIALLSAHGTISLSPGHHITLPLIDKACPHAKLSLEVKQTRKKKQY